VISWDLVAIWDFMVMNSEFDQENWDIKMINTLSWLASCQLEAMAQK
jgi:hypothetical protein